MRKESVMADFSVFFQPFLAVRQAYSSFCIFVGEKGRPRKSTQKLSQVIFLTVTENDHYFTSVTPYFNFNYLKLTRLKRNFAT